MRIGGLIFLKIYNRSEWVPAREKATFSSSRIYSNTRSLSAWQSIKPSLSPTMRAATLRQWLLKDYPGDYFIDFIHVTAAFFRPLEVFFELVLKIKIEHLLFFFQYFPQLGLQFFLCGGGMIPFHLDFPAHYIPGFLHGGQGYGVKRRVLINFKPLPGGFYRVYSVHKRLFCLKYTPFWGETQLSAIPHHTGMFVVPA
jgi:hypothetical protein